MKAHSVPGSSPSAQGQRCQVSGAQVVMGVRVDVGGMAWGLEDGREGGCELPYVEQVLETLAGGVPVGGQ